ncbi:TrmH family RNA methyltransferase [Crocinitomix catalasitica]|uniref:TrmH family RNA methyltransferase n=1 Tax=Crocinitomix catalasitica TaxID=184607 RepID=UPI0004867EDC|nr:RNA methyltransferase [Crocinitomix catalasitica]|tara:strand:+ start:58 stop:795 length:738 start_codon:yes stop_codon:yes gene_type:complete
MPISKNEIKLVKSLQLKKYRESLGLFVVEGIKLTEELFGQSKYTIDRIFCTNDYAADLPENVPFERINEKDLERISGLKQPNKILAVVQSQPQNDAIDFEDTILILDDIKDPGNLGTILRTADWFGIKQIVASSNSVDLYNPKVIQSSMGAIYRINFSRMELADVLNDLSQHEFEILGAELNGTNLYEKKFETKTALVMGSESHGISDELKSRLTASITIPKFGETESLNVAMATGIILSQMRGK